MRRWRAWDNFKRRDSLEMLSDASVYAVSLYAVGRVARVKRAAATASGVLQITLGIGVLVEGCRRFLVGGEPIGVAMIAMGCIAFAANALCLWLLARHRHGDVNLRASWIFTANSRFTLPADFHFLLNQHIGVLRLRDR